MYVPPKGLFDVVPCPVSKPHLGISRAYTPLKGAAKPSRKPSQETSISKGGAEHVSQHTRYRSKGNIQRALN